MGARRRELDSVELNQEGDEKERVGERTRGRNRDKYMQRETNKW